MNYYIFYCPRKSSFIYLRGTHYVGVWANTYFEALTKCKSYTNDKPVYIETPPKDIQVGYLY